MRLFYALWENPHKFPHKFMKICLVWHSSFRLLWNGHIPRTCQSWRGLTNPVRCLLKISSKLMAQHVTSEFNSALFGNKMNGVTELVNAYELAMNHEQEVGCLVVCFRQIRQQVGMDGNASDGVCGLYGH